MAEEITQMNVTEENVEKSNVQEQQVEKSTTQQATVQSAQVTVEGAAIPGLTEVDDPTFQRISASVTAKELCERLVLIKMAGCPNFEVVDGFRLIPLKGDPTTARIERI